MIVPRRVFTSGWFRLAKDTLEFHSRPSGCRIARSYCSRDVNGNGTPSTTKSFCFAPVLWLMITCFSFASLRSGTFTGAATRGFFGCGAP